MRWTRRCCRRTAPTRTAKSCGPDAPTLVSSLRVMIRKRRWQESPVTGESTKETVKTIAQGMLECFGEPVVTNSCVYFYFTREAMGATGTRHSLRPLLSRGNVRMTRAPRGPREGGLAPREFDLPGNSLAV